MSEVKLEHVGKIYPGNVRAVKDVNLTVHDGEFVVLVGPSGCGKSTTLRMIAGLEEISEGTISIGDRVVNDVLPKDRDIAMVFQNYALYPDKTVFENMAFCLRMRPYQLPTMEDRSFWDTLLHWRQVRREKNLMIERRVREAAETLGITDLLDRRPKALSGGQRQRVAVGRCIVRDPAVFLFDEPLSNLDAKMRVQMRTEISRLHNKLRSTMIYVTHDQTEAMTMGDRIVVMKDGIIQQIDSPAAIYDNPTNMFVAGFIGTPPMNFFPVTVAKNAGRYELSSDTFKLTAPVEWSAALASYEGKKAVFGIRPEHIGSPSAEAQPSPQKMPAMIEVVEPMGSETYLYLRTGQTSFVARVDPHRHCRVGDTIEVAVQMDCAHVFDAETSERLKEFPQKHVLQPLDLKTF